MEKQYAQALYELAQKPGAKAPDLVKKLVIHLKKTGREKLLLRIARELGRIDKRTQSFGVLLEVASAKEKVHAEKEAKKLGITARGQVNQALITGWRARSGSRIIDYSGKRALLDLYRSIITSS